MIIQALEYRMNRETDTLHAGDAGMLLHLTGLLCQFRDVDQGMK